jgi:hypothetical protein
LIRVNAPDAGAMLAGALRDHRADPNADVQEILERLQDRYNALQMAEAGPKSLR